MTIFHLKFQGTPRDSDRATRATRGTTSTRRRATGLTTHANTSNEAEVTEVAEGPVNKVANAEVPATEVLLPALLLKFYHQPCLSQASPNVSFIASPATEVLSPTLLVAR